MKARAEAEVQRRGLGDRELKRGRGGIRDVEFGGAAPSSSCTAGPTRGSGRRRRSTRWRELLRAAVRRSRRRAPTAAYTFPPHRRAPLAAPRRATDLLTLPSRHRQPNAAGSSARLPRPTHDERPRGVRGRPAPPARVVRRIHERMFFAPDPRHPRRNRSAGPGSSPGTARRAWLHDADHTRRALHGADQLTRTSRTLQQLLPAILDWLSAAPDPDLGLLQLRRLAEGPARAMSLATTFRDRPGAAERACRALGSSRIIGDALLHQPEIVELLGDDDWLVRERGADELRRAALATLGWRQDTEARRAGLRRFKRRELLRIASRDVLGLAPLDVTSRELACLADACVEAALRRCGPRCHSRIVAWAGSAVVGSSPIPPTSTSSFVLRRRGARRLRGGGGDRDCAGSRDQRDDERGPDVPGGRPAAARGEQRAAGPLARRVPRLLRAMGVDAGSSGRCCPSPTGSRYRRTQPLRSSLPVYSCDWGSGGRGAQVRRTYARWNAADPPRRGSQVPPQTRQRPH